MKVQILDWEDKLTGSIGELVHESPKQFCVLLEGGIYIPYSKLQYSYQEYKSPEDIRNQKLLDIVMEYYNDNIYSEDMINQVNNLFMGD